MLFFNWKKKTTRIITTIYAIIRRFGEYEHKWHSCGKKIKKKKDDIFLKKMLKKKDAKSLKKNEKT